METGAKQRPTPGQIAFRVLFYLAGLQILAFGVTLAKKATLGISPISSTPLAIFEALSLHDATKITLGDFAYSLSFGNCVTIFYCFLILIQILILRREYKPYNLFQILVSFLFGWFVDFAGFVLGGLSVSAYMARLGLTLVSVVVIALGISLYLSAKLLPMPSEGVGMVIADKLKKPYHKIKVFTDCAMVACAVTVMLAAGGNPLAVVREGTVIIAIFGGPVMGLWKRLVDPLAGRLGFGRTAKAADAEEPGAAV